MSNDNRYIWDSPELSDQVIGAELDVEYLLESGEDGYRASGIIYTLHELVDIIEDRELIIMDILEKVADCLGIKIPAPEDDDWKIPMWVLDKLAESKHSKETHDAE